MANMQRRGSASGTLPGMPPGGMANMGRRGSASGAALGVPGMPGQGRRASMGRRSSRVDLTDECVEIRKQEKEEAVLDCLRETLIKQFGDAESAFSALDWNETGMLSCEELMASLDEWGIVVEKMGGGGIGVDRLFVLLDIDGSGQLSIDELMETSPFRAEDEALLLFRRGLILKFRSRDGVYDALDADGDGNLTLEELETGLREHHIDPKELTGGILLDRVFDMLDYSLTGDLSMAKLFDDDPREESKKRDAVLNKLRTRMLDHFGSSENIMRSLDANNDGSLTFEELKSGLMRAHFDYEAILKPSVTLKWVYRFLDCDNSGDLSINELMVSDPIAEAAKKTAARRDRFMTRKKKAAKRPKKEDEATIFLSVMLPECSPREVADLGPPLQKIALFGVEDLSKAHLALEPPVELDLSHSCIEKKGAARLAHALLEPRMGNLQSLQLWGNYIGVEGVSWLAASLKSHGVIRSLGLAWNCVDDDGAKRLAFLCSKVKSLRDLDLSFNRINTPGAMNFAQAIMMKCPLKRLNLSHNLIQSKGANKIKIAARKGAKVNMEGNPSEIIPFFKVPPVAVAPGPGGLMLPQIKNIIVCGWPRRSTTASPRDRRKSHSSLRRDSKSSMQGSRQSSRSRLPGTASALNKFHNTPLQNNTWPAGIQLAKSLSEATLSTMSPTRNWTREAIMRHTTGSFGKVDHFPPRTPGSRQGKVIFEEEEGQL